MKKTILNLVLAGMVLLSSKGAAQVSAYTFSQSTGAYGPLNTGSLVGGTVQDDDVTQVALPFGFTFNGTTYSTVNVCSNGYMSFAALSGFEYSAISDQQTSELIAPFAQDLFMGTVITGDLTQGSNTITNVSFINNLNIGDSIMDFLGDFGNVNPIITGISMNAIVVNINAQNTVQGTDIFINNGSIRQNVSGTSPNRVAEFEYKNMTRFAVHDEVINFKVRLFETSNKIEFAYGPMFVSFIATPTEVGLKGASSLDFNSRLVDANNTWASSNTSSLITDFCDFSVSSMPGTGLTYTWNPAACSSPVLNVVQSNSAICAGQSATLIVSGATTYSWSNGASTATISVSPANTTTYTAYGFNGSCSSTLSVVQQVIPSPALNVTQSSSTICAGQNATLTLSGAASYSWSTGSMAASIVVAPANTTSYVAYGFNGSCASTLNIVQSVTQNPTLTVAQTKSVICRGTSATLTVNGANTYTWSNGASASVVVVSPTLSTTYTVTGANGLCVAQKTITQLVSACTGITEEDRGTKNLSVFPNPFTNEFTVVNVFEQEANVNLFDMLGNCVYTGKIAAEANETISSAHLQSGMYLLVIDNGNQKASRKVIKNQ
ncbi:MAG: T9SS type A sorting domain-containing protein [Bacteroidia bacterium]|nr:T9SS type A sorting domain-containing protein [Bacteroidia bacterium]